MFGYGEPLCVSADQVEASVQILDGILAALLPGRRSPYLVG